MDFDFCERCGEYLRWEESGISAPVPAEEDPVPPGERRNSQAKSSQRSSRTGAVPTRGPGYRLRPRAQPTTPYAATNDAEKRSPDRADPVLVTLAVPGGESRAGDDVTVSVDPGSTTILVALVRNQSGIVDNYDLSVEGLPHDWWSIAPTTIYLVPYGAASGEYEHEVAVTFHPPRASEAEARVWPVTVVATSHAKGTPAGDATATLEIKPYHELEAEMRPKNASGRRRARYAIALRNRANVPVDIELSGLDPEGILRFTFEKQRFAIDPGRRNGSVFGVWVTRGMLFGRSVPRRFEIASTVIGSDVGALPKPGTFVQKPWVPAWAIVLGALLVIGAIAAYLLWPHPVSVPSLEGKEVFAAQQLLDQAGLALGNRTEKATNEARPGTVLRQTPAAGEEIDRGDEVSILVAVATEAAVVPDIVGLTMATADQTLSKAEFSLGDANPEPADPEHSKIVSQIPLAGAVARKGRAVDVYFGVEGDGGDRSRLADEAVTSVADAKAKGRTTAGKPAGGNIEVPDLSESTRARASEELTQARLTPVAGVLYTADVPAGHLVTQSPEPGTTVAPWTKVAYFYAAAYPELAFEADGDLFTMNGARGTRTGTLVKSRQFEGHPAWNPTGTTVAFRRGTPTQAGQIWLVDRDGSRPARQLTNTGFDDRRPAFSPNGKVIAFVRGPLDQHAPDSRDYDLCLVKASGGEPACIRDEANTVHRPTWAPDGHTILVTSEATTGSGNRELVEYTSSKPNSPQRTDWHPSRPLTEALHAARAADSVAAAALSPDGKRVALSVNWGTGASHLVLATWNGHVLSQPIEFPKIRSCELSWRRDGGELALVQRGDYCKESGMIARFDLRHPSTVPLTPAGHDAGSPAWSPN